MICANEKRKPGYWAIKTQFRNRIPEQTAVYIPDTSTRHECDCINCKNHLELTYMQLKNKAALELEEAERIYGVPV